MVLPATNCDIETMDCQGTSDEMLQGRDSVDLWKTIIIGLWAWFNTFFFWTFLTEPGMKVSFRVGTTQKLYDFTWSWLMIMHVLVWGVEAFMWPWTYAGWPKFNAVYVLLWTWLGQWAGLGAICLQFILLAVVLSEAEVGQSVFANHLVVSFGHSGKNNTPDTDTVLKDDVRYTLAMYLAVEAMYLTNWFMYGKDALAYYTPEEETRFEYEIAPLNEQSDLFDTF